ncbi:MAG: hypothetical protein SFY67_10410 [Candidatus Melainabacteria bacterium]|nr:hypothetical protein [Candidatus Melainabacteria bacterium]
MMSLFMWSLAIIIGLAILAKFIRSSQLQSNNPRVDKNPGASPNAPESGKFSSSKKYVLDCIENAEVDSEKLMSELMSSCADILSIESPSLFSFYKGRNYKKLSEQERSYLRFESILFLYFWSDVSAFSHKQNEVTRDLLRETVLETELLEKEFYSSEPDLEELVIQRLKGYIESYKSGSPMFNPYQEFLHNLTFLAQNKKPRNSIAIPITGAFESLTDYMTASTGLTGVHIYLKTLKCLFERKEKFDKIESAEVKRLILQTVSQLKPMNFDAARAKEPAMV